MAFSFKGAEGSRGESTHAAALADLAYHLGLLSHSLTAATADMIQAYRFDFLPRYTHILHTRPQNDNLKVRRVQGVKSVETNRILWGNSSRTEELQHIGQAGTSTAKLLDAIDVHFMHF